MIDFKPDEKLEAKEFEAATSQNSKWSKISRPHFGRVDAKWFLNKWLVGLVLILIVLFGGRWLHHVLKKDESSPKPTPVVTAPAPVPAQTSAPTPAPTTSSNSTQKPTQVPNTGPGDTVAIFAVVTIAAGLFHYRITSRNSR